MDISDVQIWNSGLAVEASLGPSGELRLLLQLEPNGPLLSIPFAVQLPPGTLRYLLDRLTAIADAAPEYCGPATTNKGAH